MAEQHCTGRHIDPFLYIFVSYPNSVNVFTLESGGNVRLLSYILVLVMLSVSTAQIPIEINSNDPAYPFPQFQPYLSGSSSLGNLATTNPVGVTHAEMEKTIRDAYRIQMNRAEKPGGGVGGIDYIYYRSNPSCSEGSGYGILGAAAMADKTTFDGMWLWIHDVTMNKVKRYSDCQMSSPGYLYSRLPGWTNAAGDNSATDGDVDIALALLCAYYQWGEFMGIDDACGNPISYKEALIEFLTGMTDTLTFVSSGSTMLSGDIGIDGYFKGGDTWNELTRWAATPRDGVPKPANFLGPAKQHIDYTAPAYFHEFANFLAKEDSVKYAWNIRQFRRATASSDWLMGQFLKNPSHIPFAGWVELSGDTVATFSQFNEGEDFRCPWRTILNYLWSGDIGYSWDPKSHQVVPGVTNTYERDIGMRYAKFLWDPRQSPWNNGCVTGANDLYPYWGPAMLWTDWDLDGTGGNFFFQNWIHGTGSPSAVISQDYRLMGEMFRQLEIEFNVEDDGGDGYLTAVPFYFHGWFRLLGLLVLSGNYPAPSDILPKANMKVYLDIDKSFAFEKDTVTYTIDYRNYGSAEAAGTVIVDTLHRDFVFVSADGGGVYNNTSHTVTWNVGTVPGFKSATGVAPTTGKFSLRVVIGTATQKQYRNRVSISCANGSGWTSNDFPNNITAVMERNHLDIARRALILEQSASKSLVKPGETVEFSITFLNSSEAGWINGGRPGVSFSFSQGSEGEVATMNTMRARLFHDAEEPYIDFGNYRISYYLYDEKNTCIAGSAGCTNGWGFMQTITEGIENSQVKLVHEQVVPGSDERGMWNQRLIVQFSDPTDPNRQECLTTIDHHLAEYRRMRQRIHRGGLDPLRLVWYFHSSDWQAVNWGDAWSWDPDTKDTDAGIYYPITNDWTDPDRPDIPITTWNRKACKTATKTIDNILVEEWDGYTWRRVAGNGPMPGREALNVVIRDTIPDGLTFVQFTGENPMGVAPQINGRVITWSVPRMQIKEGGTISFTALADGTCPETQDAYVTNRAWISADKESPFADSVETAISCDTVMKPLPGDHIDIVVDTMLIDASKDNDFVRLTLDEGTQNAAVFAVVRDRNGKLLRRISGALWTSRDNAVATASAQSAFSWQGNIVKTGGGSTIIVVSEPDSAQIKPDSLAITALETPPWPAITVAVMYDENGDIIPDLLSITLNDTFHVNQRLDSVIVTYRGNVYSYAANQISIQQKSISIPFATLSGVDAQPSGEVALIMTVDGERKRVTKEISDGVGPAITEVALGRNDLTGNDTLHLTFSEDVSMATLVGTTLELIRSATGDTVVMTVLSYWGPDIYTQTGAVVSGASGVRPQEGDLVRLVPGVRGGTLVDRRSNLAHLLNPSAAIAQLPADLVGGAYYDRDANGVVESVFMRFDKPVSVNGMQVSLTWSGGHRINNITAPYLSLPSSDSSVVLLNFPESTLVANGIKTSGTMSVRVQFSASTDAFRTGQIADSAAPVINTAIYKVGAIMVADQEAVDTLLVTFSERVKIAQVTKPFLLSRRESPYSLSLRLLSENELGAVFCVTGMEGTSYPENGDSIWINPVSAVGDTISWQNNPANRRALIGIQRSAVNWDVEVMPNPFNPDIKLFDAGAVVVRIVNRVNRNAPVGILDAKLSIYDPVGNAVVASAPFTKNLSGQLVYYWNGANRNNRIVADGTYIAIITVNDEESRGSKRHRIGVRRGMPMSPVAP